MKDTKLEDFYTWFNAQPDYCSYTRVRNFLSGHLDCSKSQAEVEMAKLAERDRIKIIAKKTGNGGRRVFKAPLPPLSEADIRSVWNGSSHVSKDLNKIAANVHDRTGHSMSDIRDYCRNLHSANVTDDSFRWEPQDSHDEEDPIR